MYQLLSGLFVVAALYFVYRYILKPKLEKRKPLNKSAAKTDRSEEN